MVWTMFQLPGESSRIDPLASKNYLFLWKGIPDEDNPKNYSAEVGQTPTLTGYSLDLVVS